MAAVPKSPPCDLASFDVDKLTYDIFSILENKFLFGYDNPKFPTPTKQPQLPMQLAKSTKVATAAGKVRILTIDGGGSTDSVLAAKSLVHLEAFLRRKSGNPNARIADLFDVVAGSGAGGILAALLFTRRKDAPLFTAEEALKFLIRRRKALREGMFRRPGRAEKKLLSETFGDRCTLRDTVKPVLIPCYDLTSRAAFVFSRADALEMDGYDFKMRDVCAATTATRPLELRSVDGRTRIVGVDGRVAMNNPTAAAITHVLNNKQEFPFCNGIEDLLVLSLGNGGLDFGVAGTSGLTRIAEDGASDMVDQAVSMAFGPTRQLNYVRIQANNITVSKQGLSDEKIAAKPKKTKDILQSAEEVLVQKHVESVLFQGKKMSQSTNSEMLESFCGEIIKEEESRKASLLPTVVLKQVVPPSPSNPSVLPSVDKN